VEDFAALQPTVDCKQIYQNFYKDKMEELVERLQREKLIHEQKEKGTDWIGCEKVFFLLLFLPMMMVYICFCNLFESVVSSPGDSLFSLFDVLEYYQFNPFLNS
jgi:hypothetical protein